MHISFTFILYTIDCERAVCKSHVYWLADHSITGVSEAVPPPGRLCGWWRDHIWMLLWQQFHIRQQIWNGGNWNRGSSSLFLTFVVGCKIEIESFFLSSYLYYLIALIDLIPIRLIERLLHLVHLHLFTLMDGLYFMVFICNWAGVSAGRKLVQKKYF